ncbi:glucose 1-dehydrogenase [Pedomonas mirosovicensis]|uniref:glucose 1-dehydrogenase n=1 Tax=Pedomonas mirosovicensis TaxID=2908641 RepID=UPI002169700F|nr:glucose 1-dehydrogenase [Pedomonas mirosovicensis]MCH8684095.1 glucose 1-dehydrogenase [Pedomonas mirosovicensis]
MQPGGTSGYRGGDGRLAGKTALVTGAASGLGRAMATRFVGEGARVLLTDINGPAVEKVAAALGPAAAGIQHDVINPAQWEAALAEAERRFGGLHILVNNAGIGAHGTVEETSLEDWRRVHAVDLDSVFLGCKLALPVINRTASAMGGRGSILNISSIAGVIASANLAAYNSAKAAVRHLTKSVALHCTKARYPITCNSVHPTFIDTPILDGMAPDLERQALLEKLGRQIPMGRVGEPDDVAHAAVYLCSDEARYVTGAELYIDGGVSAM